MSEGIRINKYLSQSGYCSRRHADELIEQGLVTIDGITAQCGSRVFDNQVVKVLGREVTLQNDKIIYALYKPAGYISSLSDEQGTGIGGFLKGLPRMYPVGRLDKDSEGLILLTNDGQLMNNILRAQGGHEKEYIVSVDHKITDDFIDKMQKGVMITDRYRQKKVMTAPCKVRKISDNTFSIILIQGLNRQIRRMCGNLGYKVVRLVRIRIMNITLDEMTPGQIRPLDGSKYKELRKMAFYGQDDKN